MSNFERIQVLLDFLEEEPDNPFNLYALALEYQNIEPEKAEIYEFMRGLESLKSSLSGSGKKVLVLDKDSELVDILYGE